MTDKDFVIVDIKSAQEQASEGDTLYVKRLEAEVGSKVTFDKVLLSVKGTDIKVGKPAVEGASVEVVIEEHLKGPKVTKRVYKSKSRYRRNIGSRQHLTKIKINKIKF